MMSSATATTATATATATTTTTTATTTPSTTAGTTTATRNARGAGTRGGARLPPPRGFSMAEKLKRKEEENRSLKREIDGLRRRLRYFEERESMQLQERIEKKRRGEKDYEMYMWRRRLQEEEEQAKRNRFFGC